MRVVLHARIPLEICIVPLINLLMDNTANASSNYSDFEPALHMSNLLLQEKSKVWENTSSLK